MPPASAAALADVLGPVSTAHLSNRGAGGIFCPPDRVPSRSLRLLRLITGDLAGRLPCLTFAAIGLALGLELRAFVHKNLLSH